MSWLENFKHRMRTPKQMQRLDDNTYYGGNLGGITITKKRKKPYKWVSPRGAGNMTVMPGDPEMVFFAPIAAGAGIAASPAISSAVGSAVSGINTVGDAVAATAAGQRLTSGLNFAANAIGNNKAWPWIDAGLTSIFGAHGIDKVRRGDIHNAGDVVETGLDLLPLSQLARPIVNTASRIATNAELYSATRNPIVSEGYTTVTPKIRTRVGDVEINNPQLAYRQGKKDIVDDFISSGEVRTPEEDYAQPIMVTIKSKKNPEKEPFVFNLSKSFDNPMFAQGYLWYGVPEKAGSGLLTTAEPLGIATKESHLVKSVSNGTFDLRYPYVGKSGRRVQLYDGQLSPFNTSAYLWEPGYGYRKVNTGNNPVLPWNEALNYTPTPRGLISREPLIAGGTPEITAENATSITPKQWTAAQDAAIAKGDMAEAQRLRDLHSKVYGDPIISYHGQMMPDKMYISRRANPYSDARTSHSASGYFSSSSNPVANTYNFIDGSPTFKLYTHFKNPYIIDAKGGDWRAIGTDRIYRDYVENGKHDGAVIRNVIDIGSRRDRLNGASEIADDIISSPGHSKLADAVTYDDKGVRIPLGERDNFKLNDIRYSWLAPLIGLGTLGTLSNRKQQ